MDNVEFMKIFDTCDDLMEEVAGLRLLDPLVADDVIKELPSLSVLHNKV
jgi:hypothetical protein